jgi:cobalt-zinc-cadmium resistance protein CzcA
LIKSLLVFGLTRSAIIVLGVLVFCAAGLVAFTRLNIEAYPNPAPVILEVTAQAVGLYPTPGVVNVRSTSFYGLSFVRVTFAYGVDFYFALMQASISLQQNVTLPGNLVPTIQQSSLVGEIYRYQLVGPPHFGLTNLRTLQDFVVTRRLLTIPGVVQINAWGGTTKQFNVDADLQKLEAYNITVPQLISALGNANVNVGGREIAIGQQSVNIRGVGLVDSGGADDVTKGYRVQDVENVVLTQSNGLPIQVKDVANVSVGYVPRLGIAGRDGDDDVAAAIVVMRRTEHTGDIIPKVQEMVERLNSDGSLVLRGEDANLLSLGAVDFGIIVDSAVIMMENIYRNFQSSPEERRALLQHLAEGYWGADPTSSTANGGGGQRWTERLRIIFVSALQVDKAVFFTAAITVTAFVPLFTMQGVEGQIFGPMARTYGYALAGALLATFTVTPVLAALLLPKHIEEVETIFVRGLRASYTPVLRWALGNLAVSVTIGVVFLAASFLAGSRLGSEFLPALEEGNFWIRAAMPPTMSLEAGTEATRKMREILLRHPEVITVVSQHGRPDNGSDASPFSNVELFAPLKPFDEWPANLTKEKLTEELQKEFSQELPGIGFNFSQYIQDNVEEALSGVKGANSVKIVGTSLETLEKLGAQVMAEMATVPGVADLGIFHVLGQPNLNIKIDRAKAARYGLNTGDVNTVVQAALGGTVATNVLESDRSFGLAVRLGPKYRASIDAIGTVKVAYPTPSGTNGYVPLNEIADISLDTGASFIYRERSQRYIPIKFSVRGRDLGGTVAEAQERVARAVKLPNGYRILWSGEFEDLQNAKARLAVVVPITLLLILVLLYGLFNSLRDSLLALAGIPFSVGGGIIALYFSSLDFSVSAAIGFISLFGVAVMDGILNITYFRELRARGMDIAEAIFRGAEQRMRPMLMTALSAGVGLLPAAISQGIGSQVQRPLATVVVGGMFIGPLLLLIVAPALRRIFLARDTTLSIGPGREEGADDAATGEGAI